MVLDADTVVDPGAVVVEALDALVADGTVARARRPNDLAVRTQLHRVYKLQQVDKTDLFWLFDEAWVRKDTAKPEDNSNHLYKLASHDLIGLHPQREHEQLEAAIDK